MVVKRRSVSINRVRSPMLKRRLENLKSEGHFLQPRQAKKWLSYVDVVTLSFPLPPVLTEKDWRLIHENSELAAKDEANDGFAKLAAEYEFVQGVELSNTPNRDLINDDPKEVAKREKTIKLAAKLGMVVTHESIASRSSADHTKFYNFLCNLDAYDKNFARKTNSQFGNILTFLENTVSHGVKDLKTAFIDCKLAFKKHVKDPIYADLKKIKNGTAIERVTTSLTLFGKLWDGLEDFWDEMLKKHPKLKLVDKIVTPVIWALSLAAWPALAIIKGAEFIGRSIENMREDGLFGILKTCKIMTKSTIKHLTRLTGKLSFKEAKAKFEHDAAEVIVNENAIKYISKVLEFSDYFTKLGVEGATAAAFISGFNELDPDYKKAIIEIVKGAEKEIGKYASDEQNKDLTLPQVVQKAKDAAGTEVAQQINDLTKLKPNKMAEIEVGLLKAQDIIDRVQQERQLDDKAKVLVVGAVARIVAEGIAERHKIERQSLTVARKPNISAHKFTDKVSRKTRNFTETLSHSDYVKQQAVPSNLRTLD